MTIRQFINKKGWQIECDSIASYRSMDVDIGFENNGTADETQFLIKAYDINELAELFSVFCKENNIPRNTVTNITIVQMHEEKA